MRIGAPLPQAARNYKQFRAIFKDDKDDKGFKDDKSFRDEGQKLKV